MYQIDQKVCEHVFLINHVHKVYEYLSQSNHLKHLSSFCTPNCLTVSVWPDEIFQFSIQDLLYYIMHAQNFLLTIHVPIYILHMQLFSVDGTQLLPFFFFNIQELHAKFFSQIYAEILSTSSVTPYFFLKSFIPETVFLFVNHLYTSLKEIVNFFNTYIMNFLFIILCDCYTSDLEQLNKILAILLKFTTCNSKSLS